MWCRKRLIFQLASVVLFLFIGVKTVYAWECCSGTGEANDPCHCNTTSNCWESSTNDSECTIGGYCVACIPGSGDGCSDPHIKITFPVEGETYYDTPNITVENDGPQEDFPHKLQLRIYDSADNIVMDSCDCGGGDPNDLCYIHNAWGDGDPSSYTWNTCWELPSGEYTYRAKVRNSCGNDDTTWNDITIIQNRLPRGYFDRASCLTWRGWAQDEDSPNAHVTVKFYSGTCSESGLCNGVYVGEVTADRYRIDLDGYAGNGDHGFVYDAEEAFCDAGLCDGSVHDVYAYAVDTNNGDYKQLNNSPKSVGPRGPKFCSAYDLANSNFLWYNGPSSISDDWCTANESANCIFTQSGNRTVSGQTNPSYWDPGDCSSSLDSTLYSSKRIIISDLDQFRIRARMRTDDKGYLYVNENVTVAGSNCSSSDSCASCGQSSCEKSWVNYNVYIPQTGEYIMNMHLKHDDGPNDDSLSYLIKFDNSNPTNTSRPFLVYPATKGNNSWEWATIDLGRQRRGWHTFSFALGEDGYVSPGGAANDLNAYVDQITFTRASVITDDFAWTGWTDITNLFYDNTDNLVRFKAVDYCSGSRYTHVDFEVRQYPSNISFSPSDICTGDSRTVTFTTQHMDPDGVNNLRNVRLLINSNVDGRATSSPVGAFYGMYNMNTDHFYIRNDDNSAWLDLGVRGSLTTQGNSYVDLLSTTNRSVSGNTLTVNWVLRFKNNGWNESANAYIRTVDDQSMVDDWEDFGNVNVDSSPPATPGAPSVSCVAGSVDQATVSWNAVSDVGCAGMHSTGPYHIQVWDAGPNQINENRGGDDRVYLNEWRSGTSVVVPDITVDQGKERVLYARVRARDNLNQRSSWSPQSSLDMLTCLPTATIQGLAWDDTNTYNCSRDSVADDPGLGGLDIFIIDVDSTYCGGSPCEATTDSNGNYSLTNVPYYPSPYTALDYTICSDRPRPAHDWDKLELSGSCGLDGDNCDVVRVTGNLTHNFAFKNTPSDWIQASDGDVHTNEELSVEVPGTMYPGIEPYFLTDTSSTDTKGGIATSLLNTTPRSSISERGSAPGWSDEYYDSRGQYGTFIWPTVIDEVVASDGVLTYESGDVTINADNYDSASYQNKIIIAEGDINIAANVGARPEETDGTASAEVLSAILISKGRINVLGTSNIGATAYRDRLFKIEGAMYAKEGFNFERDLENTRIPVAQATFDPAYYFNAPDSIKEPKIYLWEEVTSPLTCICGDWADGSSLGSCGSHGCGADQMPYEQTRSCSPAGCGTESQVVGRTEPSCTCSCGDWTLGSQLGSCGDMGCDSDEVPYRETRSCSPSGCDTESRTICRTEASCTCSCGSWSLGSALGGCGDGGCASNEIPYVETRSCSPSGCDTETRNVCREDTSCTTCTCSAWSLAYQVDGCGSRGCDIDQVPYLETRTCTPSGCDTTSRETCRTDANCCYYICETHTRIGACGEKCPPNARPVYRSQICNPETSVCKSYEDKKDLCLYDRSCGNGGPISPDPISPD